MQIDILGCRGSYPIAHPSILRYGGDTTSIQVMTDDTAVILDAGTGIRKLKPLPSHLKEAHLFITHLHWDHIMGFPECPLLDSPDTTLHIYSLERLYDRFYAALEQSLSKPLTPHNLEEMAANIQFHELRPGTEVLLGDQLSVGCALGNHPYQALGYRIQHGRESLVFVPDTAPFDRYLFEKDIVYIDTPLTPEHEDLLIQRQDALLALAEDTDWMIYDAAMTTREYELFPHWGHSTMDQAVEMGRAARTRELIFFHHNPTRTDDELDRMTAEQQARHPDMYLSSAYAGMRRGNNTQ